MLTLRKIQTWMAKNPLVAALVIALAMLVAARWMRRHHARRGPMPYYPGFFPDRFENETYDEEYAPVEGYDEEEMFEEPYGEDEEDYD